MTAWQGALLSLAALLLLAALFRLNVQRKRLLALEFEAHAGHSRAHKLQAELDALGAINRAFVEQASAAMLLVSPDGRVRFFNAAAATLFSLEPGSAEPTLAEAVHDHEVTGLVSRVLAGQTAMATVEARPPGTNLVLQATAQAVRGDRGDLFGAAVLVEDLTGLRRLEAGRRDLVANVSHELRTPLAAMKALVETLESGVDDADVKASFLAKLHVEVDRLALLVHDLLELSRIESGGIRLDIKAASIELLARQAAERVSAHAARAGVSLEVAAGDDATVLADAGRGEQVLVNLLQNALRFTPALGKVTISWLREADEVTVHVLDTGIGIQEEELPRIFERFYKVDKGRAYANGSGTGLGLAIVKHLVTSMDGRVGVHSTPGQGSDFFFTLPAVELA